MIKMFVATPKMAMEDDWFDFKKLYGYHDYKYVKKSFNYLLPFMREQWDRCYTNPEEAYRLEFMIGMIPGILKFDTEEFVTFIKKYLKDLKNVGDLEAYVNVLKCEKEIFVEWRDE